KNGEKETTRLFKLNQALWFDTETKNYGIQYAPTSKTTGELRWINYRDISREFENEVDVETKSGKCHVMLDFDLTIVASEKEVGDLSKYPAERRHMLGGGFGEVVFATNLIPWLKELSASFYVHGMTSSVDFRAKAIMDCVNEEAGYNVITDVFSTGANFYYMSSVDGISNPRCKSILMVFLKWLDNIAIVDDNLVAWILAEELAVGIKVPTIDLNEEVLWDVNLDRISEKLMYLYAGFCGPKKIKFSEGLR
ncbi:hypothetical protein HDU99_000807, partial [Rhizoclosmatium hyalinum]